MSKRIKIFRLVWNLGIIFFGGAFTFLPIWAEATHSIRLSPLVGLNTVKLAEREEADTFNNPYSAYQLVRNNRLLPFSQTSQRGPGGGAFRQFHLQYRFQDNLRISASHREMDALYEARSAYIPGTIVTNSDIYKWSEKRWHIGLEYYFPLGNIFKAGPLVKYYDVTQTYSNKSNNNYGIIDYNNRISYNVTRNGTETMDSRYFGLTPGIGLEIVLADWFRIGLSGEYIHWKGKRNTYFPNYSQVSLGNSRLLVLDFFSDSGVVSLRGNFFDLNFQFRPFSFFGFTIGYHKENYSRTYRNYSYRTISPEDPVDVMVYNSIVKNTNSKFSSETYYLQLDFIIDMN